MSFALPLTLGLAAGAASWPLAKRHLSSFKKKRNLADEVQWAINATPGIISQKDGSLLAAWEFRGPDLSFATGAEADNLARRMMRSLGGLRKRYMLHADSIRVPSRSYRTADGNAPLPALVCDEVRRARYDQGVHYENRKFFALTYMPLRERYRKIEQLFYSGGHETEVDWRAELHDFETELQNFEDRLPGALSIRRLRGNDLLSYLQATLTGELSPVTPPPGPAFLDFLFAEQLQSGFEPKLGSCWARVVAIQGYAEDAFMGILDKLDELPFPYRFSNRFIGVNPDDAMKLVKSRKGSWLSKAGSDLFSQIFGGEEERSEIAKEVQSSSFAENQSRDASAAMEKLESGKVHMLHHTGCVIVMHEDFGTCNERARKVEKALRSSGSGFVVRREKGLATQALLGSLPGHGYHNVRRYPLLTDYAARLLPLSSTYAGPEETPCSKYEEHSPPMFYAKTSEQVPFRFTPFGEKGDVGHEIIIGPTGAGKSILLGYQALRQLHFRGGQVVLFDKGYSFAPLCEAMGGSHYDLGSSLGLQPLAHIDDSEELRSASSWIQTIARIRGENLTPNSIREINAALRHMATRPASYRTLQELKTQVQDRHIQNALAPFAGEGALGQLLNATSDGFTASRFQVIELGSLLDLNADLYTPVLLYLFHRTNKGLGPSTPTLVAADEFFKFASKTKAGRDYAMEAFREYRKRNAVMVIATQVPSDLTKGDLVAAVDSAKTMIFLPNIKAKNQMQAPAYRALGLSEEEIETIATADEKAEYISKQPGGTRKWNLDISPEAAPELAFMTAADGLSLQGTAEKMAAFKEEHGKRWVEEWLKFRGYDQHLEAARRVSERFHIGDSSLGQAPQSSLAAV